MIQMQERREGRMMEMDLLRIAACVMVVVIHVVAEGMPATTPGTFQWYVLSGFTNVCRAAVPVFFMLSGMFSRSTDWKRAVRRALRFLALYLLATVFYQLVYVLDCLYVTVSDSRPFVQAFADAMIEGLLLPKYHLWFLPEYIAIIVVSPLIHAAFEHKPALIDFAAGLFFVGSVLPESLRILFGGNRTLFAALAFLPDVHLSYLGYYIMGRFLADHRQQLKGRTGNALILAGAVSLAGVYVLTHKASMALGSMNEAYFNHFFIGVFLEAVAWVALFERIRVPQRWHGLISRLAGMTLGVYLSHLFVIEVTARLGLRSQRITTIIGVPLKTAAVLLICFALCFAWDGAKHRAGRMLRR